MKRAVFPLFLLAFLALTCVFIIDNSDEVSMLTGVEIKVNGEEPVTIGISELGQRPGYRSAEREHMAFRKKDGRIEVANMGAVKKVDTQTSRFHTYFVKRFPLHKGDRFLLGKVSFIVDDVSDKSLVLRNENSGETAVWKDKYLHHSDPPPPISGLYNRLKNWWHHFWLNSDFADREDRLFKIGGIVNTDKQWAVEGLLPGSAGITWLGNKFYLAPGGERRACFKPADGSREMFFQDIWMPLDGEELGRVSQIVAGKTYYSVKVDGDRVQLKPIFKVDAFPAGKQPEVLRDSVSAKYTTVSWIGSGKPVIEWIIGLGLRDWLKIGAYALIAVFLFVFPVFLLWRLGEDVPVSLYLFVPLAFFNILFWRIGAVIDLSWWLSNCLLIWFWATALLAANGKLEGEGLKLWSCAVGLAGFGLVTLLQLFAGSASTHWGGFFEKQVLALSCCGLVIGVLACMPRQWWYNMMLWLAKMDRGALTFRRFRLFCGVLMFIFMVVYGLFAKEQGLMDIQPAEALKIMLVILGAFAALDLHIIRSDETFFYRLTRREGRKQVLKLLGFLILLSMMSVLSLGAVKDMSPILIIGAYSMFWLWQIGPGPRWQTPHWFVDEQTSPVFGKAHLWCRGLVVGSILLVVAAVAWGCNHPDFFKSVHKAERIATWLDPGSYPHSGAQVIGAMKMVGTGGWSGVGDSLFGSNGIGNSLPAVQDDFALSFLLYRFGGLAGLGLLAFQLGYIFVLFRIGRNALRIDGNYDRRYGGVLFCYFVQGGAVIHLIQWTISWCNTLGLLPVMGQPMTWLSAGNSHLFTVGLVTLVAGLTINWATEIANEQG